MRVLAVLLFWLGSSLALAPEKSTLVLLENVAVKETHSIYFNMLQRLEISNLFTYFFLFTIHKWLIKYIFFL